MKMSAKREGGNGSGHTSRDENGKTIYDIRVRATARLISPKGGLSI